MNYFFLSLFLLLALPMAAQDTTYAERLGFPRGKKVIVLHVDDVGMSQESNRGAIRALEEGISTSASMMMACPWVPQFMTYLKAHPKLDVGIHLTMTSEWANYRWGPLTGTPAAKGLIDKQGAFWPSVAEVVTNASPDEVEAEMRAQIARFRAFGIEPTHIDSHMGTLFQVKFLMRYVKVAIDEKIPALFPGGHATLVSVESRLPESQKQLARQVGKQLWNAGLPVFDDLDGSSYGWTLPNNGTDPAALRKMKTGKYIDLLNRCQPGLTYVIMHCTETSPHFDQISNSGPTRHGDLLAMLDPALKAYIQKEGIILTTCRELMERRKKVNVK